MTDQGTENCNAEIDELCHIRGIEHHLSAPAHPQSNAMVLWKGKIVRIKKASKLYWKAQDCPTTFGITLLNFIH